ncbi:hypothetical protein [Ralstonia pseudosolanacearum]|uniref:hypothetical protein n=1 Tax=Ralstonia pseudosolanacearum TaxID=1310165 RepID=UPI001FF8929E
MTILEAEVVDVVGIDPIRKAASLNMLFPEQFEFLEKFGIEPTCFDPSAVSFSYRKEDSISGLSIEISFSGVEESFQVRLFRGGDDVAIISSERVRSISVFEDDSGKGVRVAFDFQGLASEAPIILEPVVNMRWWILRAN